MTMPMDEPDILAIQRKWAAGFVEFTRHATDRSIRRSISIEEIRQAVSSGAVIEDYPDDKYGPSCLIFGFTTVGRPLHVHCSYPTRPLVKVITVYEPDATLWIDFKSRRPTIGL